MTTRLECQGGLRFEIGSQQVVYWLLSAFVYQNYFDQTRPSPWPSHSQCQTSTSGFPPHWWWQWSPTWQWSICGTQQLTRQGCLASDFIWISHHILVSPEYWGSSGALHLSRLPSSRIISFGYKEPDYEMPRLSQWVQWHKHWPEWRHMVSGAQHFSSSRAVDLLWFNWQKWVFQFHVHWYSRLHVHVYYSSFVCQPHWVGHFR